MSRPQHPTSNDDRTPAKPKSVRLNRFLASAGLGSRRNVEELILEGRVSINGDDVFELHHQVDPESDDVRLDGEKVNPRRHVYYLLNKPTGYLCTHRDPQGRPRAIDLVPAADRDGLFTVGRLDESSSGLLIVTNDGDLANRLAHPRYQVARTYRVQVAGVPTPETIRELTSGVYFSDGKFRVTRARRLKTHKQSAYMEVELKQGRNREIRRLFAKVGHKVISLERIAFGPVRLAELPSGAFRKLSKAEVDDLKKFASGAPRWRGPKPGGAGRRKAAAAAKKSNSRRQSNNRRGAARNGNQAAGRSGKRSGGSKSGRKR